MLDYTVSAIDIIKEDIQKFSRGVLIASKLYTSLYFVYALVSQSGIFVVNIILATLFFGYTLFDIFFGKKLEKKVKKVVKRSYSWTTLTIRLIPLGATIYGIYTATTSVTNLSILFATLMVILWVFQVMLELFVTIFDAKVELIMMAVKQDMDNIKKPITNVKNVFKRMKGEEIPPEPEKTRGILAIEKRIAAKKAAKQEAKLKAKQEKKDKRRNKPLKVKSNPEVIPRQKEELTPNVPMIEKQSKPKK